MKKNIAHILEGREKWITPTEKVLQPLPHKDFRFANPFIVIHHGGPDEVRAGSDNRIHPHPHRGFAPVTFLLQGEFHHKDTTGNDQILRAGDVQWMFAGKGLLHSEGPSAQMHQQGGTSEMIQLWINVPAAHKWDDPRYQYLSHEEMPRVLQQDGVSFRLASGELDGKTGPIDISYTPVISAIGTVAQGKQATFEVENGYWALLYVAHGQVRIDEDKLVHEHHLIIFEKDGTHLSITANEDSQLLFLAALPINEPVSAKDNFVMTTPEEVDQAIADYKDGVFGTLDY